MTEQDRATEKAEELLTRFPDNWSPSHREIVVAVAAELRKAYAEIERLQKIHSAEGTFRCTCNSYPHSPNCGLDERLISQRAKIARLRAELVAKEQQQRRADADIALSYGPDPDAAELIADAILHPELAGKVNP